MISQTELSLWATWGPDAVFKRIEGQSMVSAMRFRRELQVALAAYAKHHKMDEVQGRIISHTRLIEICCWREWWRKEMKKRMRNDPVAVRMGGKGLKIQLRKEWEEFLKKVSY